MPIITTTQIETAIVQPFSRILRELGLQEDALRVNTLKNGAMFFQGDELTAVFSIDKVRDTAQGLGGGFFISGVSQEELRKLVIIRQLMAQEISLWRRHLPRILA